MTNRKWVNFGQKKNNEVKLLRKNATEEQRKKEIEDLEKEIEELEKKKEEKKFHYDCLWIHYYNRTPKNRLRKVLDFLDNPFKIVHKAPHIAGLIEDKKE